MAQGGEGRRHRREGRSFERSLRELDQALQRGARYRRHPPEGVLRRYVQGGLPDPDSDPGNALPRAIHGEADLLSWLEGERGWSLTVVSLHVVSCRRCRRRVALLRRLETRRRQLEGLLPKWKGIQRTLTFLLLRPSWLRSSTAVLLVVALAALLFLFLAQPPPSTSPPIHPEKERISGSGLG